MLRTKAMLRLIRIIWLMLGFCSFMRRFSVRQSRCRYRWESMIMRRINSFSSLLRVLPIFIRFLVTKRIRTLSTRRLRTELQIILCCHRLCSRSTIRCRRFLMRNLRFCAAEAGRMRHLHAFRLIITVLYGIPQKVRQAEKSHTWSTITFPAIIRGS